MNRRLKGTNICHSSRAKDGADAHDGLSTQSTGRLDACGIDRSISPSFLLITIVFTLLFQPQDSKNCSIYGVEDVQATVSQIRCVRYSQKISIDNDAGTLVLTGLPAGRLLGSTVWRVVKEGEEVVYAVDVNQRKDRFLGGTTLENLRYAGSSSSSFLEQ